MSSAASASRVTTTEYDNTLEETTTEMNFVNSSSIGIHIFSCVLTALSVIGLFGNCLGAAVLNRLQKQTSGVRMLKYLAYVDMLVLLLLFEDYVLPGIVGIPSTIVVIKNGLQFIVGPLLVTIYTFEIYLTVVIACQRAVALAKPLKSAIYMRDSILNGLLVVSFVLSVVFNVNAWLICDPQIYFDSDLNANWIKCTTSDFAYSSFNEFHYRYLTLLVRTILPVFFLLICTITIIVALKNRMKSSLRKRNLDQITAVNISIIIVSLVTHVTTALERTLDGIVVVPMFPQITALVLILNCSTNVIFYCIFGRSFRRTLLVMVKQACRCTMNGRETELQISVSH